MYLSKHTECQIKQWAGLNTGTVIHHTWGIKSSKAALCHRYIQHAGCLCASCQYSPSNLPYIMYVMCGACRPPPDVSRAAVASCVLSGWSVQESGAPAWPEASLNICDLPHHYVTLKASMLWDLRAAIKSTQLPPPQPLCLSLFYLKICSTSSLSI